MGESETTAPASATPKIKSRKPRQRACNEKDAKGKMCAGHLKRWYDFPKAIAAEVRQQRGGNPRIPLELYRCHRCGTIYLPLAEELPRSYVLRY